MPAMHVPGTRQIHCLRLRFRSPPRHKCSFVMKEKYNKSTPSVSYNTAMNLLAGKLAIHSRSTGKNADRAFNDALMHARDAAHASAFRKLASACSFDKALQEAEDIAQSVAVRLFDGKVRARLISRLPDLTTEACRKRYFGKVICYAINGVMRSNLRGPRFISIDSHDGIEAGWKLAEFADEIAATSPMPSELVEKLDGFKHALKPVVADWNASKAAAKVQSRAKVKDWSPVGELLGRFDASDRPDPKILTKRTRQRRQNEVKAAIEPCL
jgi:hypothetical protein